MPVNCHPEPDDMDPAKGWVEALRAGRQPGGGGAYAAEAGFRRRYRDNFDTVITYEMAIHRQLPPEPIGFTFTFGANRSVTGLASTRILADLDERVAKPHPTSFPGDQVATTL
jgi:hypothetical protein